MGLFHLRRHTTVLEKVQNDGERIARLEVWSKVTMLLVTLNTLMDIPKLLPYVAPLIMRLAEAL